MNEVIIVSDSHGFTEELAMIDSRHETGNKIHCGDSELQVDSPFIKPYQTVKGNCDWNVNFLEEKIIEIAGLKIYVTHGHLYGVKSSLLQLQYRAEELGVDVVCFGHSHIAYAEKIGDILYINPGSIRYPNRRKKPSYVALSWDDAAHVKVQFYHVNGSEITDFPYAENFHLK